MTDWLSPKGKIVEPDFCRSFLAANPMRCIHDHFCTVDGIVSDENRIKRDIFEQISPYQENNIASTVDHIFRALKMASFSDPIPLQTDRIHVANGTYFLDGSFSAEKEFCLNRLTVSYNANAPAPRRWLQFVEELLYPEDIPTLQEYLGYCLIPSTKGQKMLMIIGKGGEGKSRIGLVMNAVFGTNMNTTSIQKVESNEYARADLEHKLLMVDDDMDMNALKKTNYIKSIVTSECRMDLERKNVQSFQAQLYVRFLCFGNGALTALHDRSDGFFRRQIVLQTKDKPPTRIDDPYLVEKMLREKEGIFLWMLEGLMRLIGNNYRFTISERARENIANVVRNANNLVNFLSSEGYIRLKADCEASSKALYAAYKLWCDDNAEHPLSLHSFTCFLSANAGTYHLESSNNIYVPGHKRCRGYWGIEVLPNITAP